MAAFDVTTMPTRLELKPGTTGTILVVVSNRTGKPVMGLIEGMLMPNTVAGWLISPPSTETQRRYEADPAATVNYEFKVAVPGDAGAQDAQFKAIVRDVLLPDDTKVEGQTVAIKVSPDAKPIVKKNGVKIPWWIWVIAAVVLIGAGVGIWRWLRPKGIPDVIGKTPEAATEALKKAGFDSVAVLDTVLDTLGSQTKDTNRVIEQVPEAKREVPDSVSPIIATIVVNRAATEVPKVTDETVAVAIARLEQARLILGDTRGQYTGNIAQNQTIARPDPPEKKKVPVKSRVDLIIYTYSATPPCPTVLSCVIEVDPGLLTQLEDHRRRMEAERVR